MNSICGFRGDYRFLSNFYEVPVAWGGVMWKTSEHAYQAAKFDDEVIIDNIFKASSPAQSKKIANQNKDKIVSGWHEMKPSIMYDIVRCKFMGDLDCASKLLDTGDAYLEETNEWNDTFWGVCDGVGRNELGKILMRVRNELNE